MTSPPNPNSELESTDLGSGLSSQFKAWLNGRLSGRVLALWVAERVESSPRLREEGKASNAMGEIDILSGGSGRSATLAKSLFSCWFSVQPAIAVVRACEFMGVPVPSNAFGFDYGRVNTVFRRLSLRSRWATTMASPVADEVKPVDLVSLHISMEIVRARLSSLTVVARSMEAVAESLTDAAVVGEITGVAGSDDPAQNAAHLNALIEDYLVMLMKLKSAGLENLAKLNRDGIYSVLGLSADATDAEIKRAYRTLAMQLHPDKGGNTELFQQLTEAYEKILESRGLRKPNEGEPVEAASPATPEQSSPEPEVVDEPPLVRIIKAAEECLKNARVASELTGKAVTAMARGADLSDPELKAQIVVFLKSVRVAGYACLDISSAALEAVKALATAEEVATITQLASEVMNSGFDALNAASRISTEPASLISMMTESSTKVIEAARLATQLAKALDGSKAEEPETEDSARQDQAEAGAAPRSPAKDEARRQREQNAEILRRLNTDLLQQQKLLSVSVAQPSVDEFSREIFEDHILDSLGETQKVFSSNILIRSVEQIVQLFTGRCAVFTASESLAVSTSAICRLAKFLLLADNEFVVALMEKVVVPALTELATLRNRSVSSEVIREAVLKELGVEKLRQRAVRFAAPTSRLSIET